MFVASHLEGEAILVHAIQRACAIRSIDGGDTHCLLNILLNQKGSLMTVAVPVQAEDSSTIIPQQKREALCCI